MTLGVYDFLDVLGLGTCVGRGMRRPRAIARVCLAAGLLASSACTRTRPFVDERGRVVPGSIATMEMVRLGGMGQSVWFRGRDVTAPPLILLHGGPGASESALFRRYDATLEQHFLVVYWEQRGTGRSYRRGMPRAQLTIDFLLRDLDALVDTVRARFGAERVVLLGHSWGTLLGTLYANSHPEKVAAYVGVAQVADFARGERVSLAWALRQARARGDERARRALCAMAPAPRTVDEELALGRHVERFGGTLRGGLSTGKLIRAALLTDEAGLADLVRFGRGNRFSLEALRPEYAHIDLTRMRRFEMPVIFLLGRHDWHVPSVLAAEWFATIEAPAKRLVWFEHSAHNPPFEEPEAFVRAMVEQVLPLVRAARPD
jgi:proline iminopeptidase